MCSCEGIVSHIHYEVKSELNPRYLQTGNMADYYGIYHVVRHEGRKRKVIRTFEASDRHKAYTMAVELQRAGE